MGLLSRRAFLKWTTGSMGAYALRCLATGIPVTWILDPRKISAEFLSTSTTPKFLIFSHSSEGDPVMCNTPGTYDIDANNRLMHPPEDLLPVGQLSLSGVSYKSAKAWDSIGASLQNTSFFYFNTKTVAHNEHPKVMQLVGQVENNEMMISAFSKLLAPQLKTLRAQPISLNVGRDIENIYYEKAPQSPLTPLGIKNILLNNKSPLLNLQELRDDTLKKMNEYLKTRGNTAQKLFLDRYIKSQNDIRTLSLDIVNLLNDIKGDGPDDQIKAAVALIHMNCSPVITVRIPFGGDNHGDADLNREAQQTVAGTQTIGNLMQIIESQGLKEKVVFALCNVFGRTMSYAKRENEGRDHHGGASGGIIISTNIKGSVCGGLGFNEKAKDFISLPIQSSTGAGSLMGDVSVDDNMASFAKTLGFALGISNVDIDRVILSGKIVQGILL